jgi:hypothetical protein
VTGPMDADKFMAIAPDYPAAVTREEALRLWLELGVRRMPNAGLRLGSAEVLPRKMYRSHVKYAGGGQDWHSEETCLMNYQGESGNSRSWFCETHHQWAYNHAVKTIYIFADDLEA